jgi:hypothetical protein
MNCITATARRFGRVHQHQTTQRRPAKGKRLKRASPQFPDAKALADTLAECKPGRRCMSGACPECARAFQRFFVAEVSNLAGNLNQDTLTSVSVIFQEHRKPEDQLQALS